MIDEMTRTLKLASLDLSDFGGGGSDSEVSLSYFFSFFSGDLISFIYY